MQEVSRDNLNLVDLARCGDRQSREALAGEIRPRLQAYVRRLTLHEDITEDIVQETMLDMVRLLGQLEDCDRFWPWLRTIAFRKVCNHRTLETRQRQTLQARATDQTEQGSRGLARLVSEELSEVVLKAMAQVKPDYRRVLTLRCYEDMSFAEIGEVTQRTEFSARVTFWRAKKALAKQLSRQGLQKGALLTALVVFGKITAGSPASAAQVSVGPACLKVGLGASLAGTATSAAGLACLGAAAVTVAGTSTVMLAYGGGEGVDSNVAASRAVYSAVDEQANFFEAQRISECQFCYPLGVGGPVMMRMMAVAADGEHQFCRYLQNQERNLYYDPSRHTVFITNGRMYDPDLHVMRLPSDSDELTAFLDRMEGRAGRLARVGTGATGAGLWVTVKEPGQDGGQVLAGYNPNLIKEEQWQNPWPGAAGVVDLRDEAHQRGWTSFRIAGQINGQDVSGQGRMPLVAAYMESFSPWIKWNVGGKVQMGSVVFDYLGRQKLEHGGTSQAGGFAGLSRPWRGLHTVDTIRRDAAERRIPFKSRLISEKEVEIELDGADGRVVYTVDLPADLIRSITFLNEQGQEQGQLVFDYE